MPRPVLIFNSTEPITVAVSRSLHKRGIPVTFADIGGSPFPGGRAFRDYVRLPNFRDEPDSFVNRLFEVIEGGGYDTLLPCSDAGMIALAPHYKRLTSLLYVGCPDPVVVNRVLDKEQTLEVARSCGLSVPTTYDVPNIETLEALQRQLRFPIIAKPRNKIDERRHAFKSRYFATFDTLRDAFLLNSYHGTENLLQEYCVGEGVGVEVLLDKGEAVALFQHRRLKELPVSGGGSVLSISEALDPLLVESAVRLLRSLQWQGVAMVEFRYHRSERRATLMEVNGRYWGSLPLAIAAGVDFPFFEWQLAHGETPAVPSPYRVGLRLHWLSGDLRRLSSLFTEARLDDFPRPSKWSESWQFVKDGLIPSRRALWSWRDPRPAVREFKRALRSVVAAFRKLGANQVRRYIAEYRCLGPRKTLEFLRIRSLYTLRLKVQRPLPATTGFRSILFVCSGNKIRSPMAEALLRKQLAESADMDGLVISSAGLLSELESRADERARTVAKEFHVSLDNHQPRPLTPALVRQADAIFIMDNLNEARIRLCHPSAMKKVFYLGVCASTRNRARNAEIPDPDLGTLADIRSCYRDLESCTRRLSERLRISRGSTAKTSTPGNYVSGDPQSSGLRSS